MALRTIPELSAITNGNMRPSMLLELSDLDQSYRMSLSQLMQRMQGAIVPETMAPADINAAITLAITNSYSGAGPAHVALVEPGTFNYQDTFHVSAQGIGGHVFGDTIPFFKLSTAPHTKMKKIAPFSNNAIFTTWVTDNLFLDLQGEFEGLSMDYVYGDGVKIAGDDGIRCWSPKRIFAENAHFHHFGDSAFRLASHSGDVSADGAHDGIFLNLKVTNSCQLSATNTSGTRLSFKRMLWVGGYFDTIHSFKFASRGLGTEDLKMRDIRIVNAASAGLEIDGPRLVDVDVNVKHAGYGVSVISNNTFIEADGGVAHGFDDIKIRGVFDDCQHGVRISGDAQAGTLNFSVNNVEIDAVIKNLANPSGIGVELNGKFRNVNSKVHLDNFAGLVGYSAQLRESTGVHAEISGHMSRNDGSGRIFMVQRKAASGVLTSAFAPHKISVNLNGVTSGLIERVGIINGMRDFKVYGIGYEGGASSILYAEPSNSLEDFEWAVKTCNVAGAAGVLLNNVIGGKISGVLQVGANGSDVLSIAASCAAVQIDQSTEFRGIAGVPRDPGTDGQLFLMASAVRATVNVDVTITHGLGTDFTVPANAHRAFGAILVSDVTEPITISSVARLDANTLRFVLAANPGGPVNIVPINGKFYNALNGPGYSYGRFLPYDNSTAHARLKEVAVVSAT